MALHGYKLCYKASFADTGEFLQFPCLSINGLKRLHSFSSAFLKPYSVFTSTSSSARPCGLLNLRIGSSSSIPQTSRLSSLTACRAKSEDSEQISSSDNIISDEQTLTQELQLAIEEENYAQAAKIRDSLKELQENSKAAVLAANARFYNAFREGDLATMHSLWAKGDNVCCVHPGASGVLGYDDVVESWEVVWMNYDFPLDIELKNVEVHFRGDMGYVTCVEFVRTKGSSWGAQFVTNVFERINGEWFICIHHASPVDL